MKPLLLWWLENAYRDLFIYLFIQWASYLSTRDKKPILFTVFTPSQTGYVSGYVYGDA